MNSSQHAYATFQVYRHLNARERSIFLLSNAYSPILEGIGYHPCPSPTSWRFCLGKGRNISIGVSSGQKYVCVSIMHLHALCLNMRVIRLETNLILGVTNRWGVQLFESVCLTFAHMSMPNLSNLSTPLSITGWSCTCRLIPTLILIYALPHSIWRRLLYISKHAP